MRNELHFPNGILVLDGTKFVSKSGDVPMEGDLVDLDKVIKVVVEYVIKIGKRRFLKCEQELDIDTFLGVQNQTEC